MIDKFGIGIDIIETKKFENKPYTTNKTFYKKIFDDTEIKYCLKFRKPALHFAGKFALKEATIKSINKKISMHSIKTRHIKSKPIVTIQKIEKKYKFLASLSHDNKYAIAIIISEK